MYSIENNGGAITLMLVGLLFGGTFSPLMLFLEYRGRLPQHNISTIPSPTFFLLC